MATPQDTRAASGAHEGFPVGFPAGTATASAGENAPVEPPQDFAQLHPHFVDPIQERYELIRPLVLVGDGTATQRAQDTHTHPETLGTLKRRFEPRGMLGLLPATLEVRRATRRPRVSPAVVAELARLQALYTGFHSRELARILFYTLGERVDHKTVKTLWLQSPTPAPAQLPLLAPAQGPARPQVRLQAVQLYARGWRKISMSRFLPVSRPTLDTWIRRFEAEHLAGLADQSSAPKSPARKTWLPLMVALYHLQKRHPEAGRLRIWSLLARPDISERTVGRVMALNKQVYPDIPPVRRRRAKQPPAPPPYKATAAHQYWFIDGRKMDVAVEGIRWWSIALLEGYSRTMLAGALAPTEATWATLMVLHTACRHDGAPTYVGSDSGGAYTSEAFEAVCTRLAIDHKTIVSPHGASYLNGMETHLNVQRRLYDDQGAGRGRRRNESSCTRSSSRPLTPPPIKGS